MTANRFRFRAWDTVMNCWLHAAPNETETLIWLKSHRDKTFTLHTFDARANRYIIMQSTGLLDRNGVEIFESDRVMLYPGPTDMKTIVVWVDGRLELAWDDNSGTPQINSDNAHLRLTSRRPDFYEVVGNVYEGTK